jgi:hypothetical protein
VTTPGRPRLRRLTRGGFTSEPTFSPDGRQLVAVRGESVEIRPLAGGRWRGVAKVGTSPDWQPVTAATRYR